MTALRVVGIDGGLARTGVGEIIYDGYRCTSLTTRLERSHPPANPSPEQTTARMTRMIRAVAPAGERTECGSCGYVETRAPDDLVMVVYEGPAFGVNTRYAHEGAGYWWRLRSILASRGIPVAISNPVHLKKWATGRGNASDAELRTAINEMWPGVMAASDDEVDGGLLALAGAQFLRWYEGGQPLRQHAELAKMTWPWLPQRAGAGR